MPEKKWFRHVGIEINFDYNLTSYINNTKYIIDKVIYVFLILYIGILIHYF